MGNSILSRALESSTGSRTAFIPSLFVALSFLCVSSSAQTTIGEHTTTSTRDFANAGQETVPAKSVVRGRVIYDDTNRPIRRARIMLLQLSKNGLERNGNTNGSGEFQIKDVPAGTYVVMVDATGVITPLSFVDIEDKSGDFNRDEIKKYFDEIVVDGNRDVTIKVRAKRGGAISGKVTYADGDPAVNVRVVVMRKKEGRLTRFITNLNPAAMFGTQTDDRGMYRVAGLAPGEYVVTASETVDHDGDGGKSRGDYMDLISNNSLVVTYYKDAVKSSEATALQIALGQDQNEVNITLADRLLHSISGSVVAQNVGTPLPDATINIASKDNASTSTMLQMPISVTTDAQGLFSISEMPDGVYSLSVEPPYDSENVDAGEDEDPSTPPHLPEASPKKRLARKQQDVIVDGNDVSDLVIKLSEGASISGVVTIEGPDPIPQYTYIRLETTSREPVAESKHVQMDGIFSIDGVPSGTYYTNVVLPFENNHYVKSMSVNGIDLINDPFTVGENSDVNGVSVLVASDGATLSGRILSVNNTPVSDAQFVLVPSDQSRWRGRSSYLLVGSANDGGFSVSGAPGDYLIIFLRSGDQPRIINETWIRNRSTTAGHVTLTPNERKNLDLTMPSQ